MMVHSYPVPTHVKPGFLTQRLLHDGKALQVVVLDCTASKEGYVIASTIVNANDNEQRDREVKLRMISWHSFHKHMAPHKEYFG